MQNITYFKKYLNNPIGKNNRSYFQLKNKKFLPDEKFETFTRATKDFDKNVLLKEGGKRVKGCYRRSLKNKPLITIVTVVLNNGKDLEKTIKSVLLQKYDNIEYIIIDGGSNGSIISKIKKYDDYIDYWISQKDDGIFDAQNKGIRLAGGDFICILNVGDYFTENGINHILKKMKKNKNLDIIFGAVKKKKIYSGFKEKDIDKTLNIFPSHVSTFINMKIYKKYGLYDLKYKLYNDYEFIYRLIKKTKLNYDITNKNELVTVFDLKGFSSRVSLFRKLMGEIIIRKKYENLIMVFLKITIKFLRFFQVKFFEPKKFKRHN